MANYESIYPGANYLLDPDYGNFTGYRIPAGELGATTSIQTSNQLSEVNKLLNQGIGTTEISLTEMKTFEGIPKQQFKEINRLNKLTGAESTLHSPIIDPSGFTEQGWSKENKALAEIQINQIIEKGYQLDPNGNIPVTIHAAGMIPGSEMIPDKEKGEIPGRMVAVEQESGKFIAIPREKRYFPEQGEFKPDEEIKFEPKKELEKINNDVWLSQLSDINRYASFGEDTINSIKKQGELTPELLKVLKEGNIDELKDNNEKEYLRDVQKAINHGQIYLKESYRNLRSLFDTAYKNSNEKDKEKLKKFAEEIAPIVKDKIENDPVRLEKFSEVIDKGLKTLGSLEQPPQIYKPIEEFTKDNASDTLSNVAFNAYDKFGKNSPIISIENPPYGTALSSGKELKGLVQETRKKFVKKLIGEGESKEQAKKIADKLIGVTWDTSHISMIRQKGFGKEKIVEETKHVAPFVKHVHFNDNFGTTHTDLPVGMGDVPIKDVLEELEKAKFKGKKIAEGGEFVAGFQTSPHPYVLEATGSPLYSTGREPFWNQVGAPGVYFSGTGPINPPIYHSTWGAGFARLPVELGGTIAGAGDTSQFSGTPNQ